MLEPEVHHPRQQLDQSWPRNKTSTKALSFKGFQAGGHIAAQRGQGCSSHKPRPGRLLYLLRQERGKHSASLSSGSCSRKLSSWGRLWEPDLQEAWDLGLASEFGGGGVLVGLSPDL